MSAERRAGTPACQPYPGLRPFLPDETHLYFGREKHRTELLRRLSATTFVAVVGTSGSGKSSLVQAGLLPDLLGGYLPGAGCDWVIVVSRPGNDPLGGLSRVFSAEGWTTDAAALRTNSSAILDLSARHLGDDQHLLVLIDQFEELFRLEVSPDKARDADEKAAFVRLLLTAGAQRPGGPSHPRVHVLIAMRSEFLGRASVYRGLPEAIDQGQYLIPRLTREQLRRAIECPAGVCQGEVDERLVQLLLNELGDEQDHLPVLQHALLRCWEFRDARNRIGPDAYQQSGELAGALSKDAKGALDDVRDTLADRGALIVQRVFQALRETDVNGGQTRRPTTVTDLCEMAGCTRAELETVLEPFRKRSFVLPAPPTRLDPETLVDVSHEALLRGWDLLTKWIEEDEFDRQRYIRIAVRAADELGTEHPDYFAPPVLPALVKFWQERNPPRAWAVRHHKGYDAAKTFLDESVRHQEAFEQARADEQARKVEADAREAQQKEALDREIARRKRAKRTTWLTVTVAGLVIMSVGFAYMIVSEQARTLEEQGNRLEALLVAARVPTIPEANLPAKLQLAVEAAGRLSDPEIQGEVLRTLWQMPMPLDGSRLAALGDPREISSLAVTPSDRWLYAVRRDRLLALDLTSGVVSLDVVLPAGDLGRDRMAELEPLMLASDEHALVLYDDAIYLASRQPGTVRPLRLAGVYAFAMSADGRTAAFLVRPGAVVVCDLSAGCSKPVRHNVGVSAPRDVALSGDGAILAVTGNELAVFDTRPWKQRAIRSMGTGGISDELAVSIDATYAHVCSSNALRAFDVYDDTLDSRIVRDFPSLAWTCTFSPAGAVTAHEDGVMRVWNGEGVLLSLVVTASDSAWTTTLGTERLAAVDGEQLRWWNLAPYGQLYNGQVFALAAGHADGPDVRVDLDGGSTAKIPPRKDLDRIRLVNESLTLELSYTPSGSGGAEDLVARALQPGGEAVEKWRYSLDAPTGSERRAGRPDYRSVRDRQVELIFGPDDRHVAVMMEGSSTILDARNGRAVRILKDKRVLLFLPGDQVLASDRLGTAAVSIENGSERRVYELPERSLAPSDEGLVPQARLPLEDLLGAAVSGNGRRLAVAATAGPTSVVHVVEWPDLEPVAELRNAAGVSTLAFRDDGERLIAVTFDGTAHIWDVEGAREIAAIPPPVNDPWLSTMAVFTPRGRIAISSGSGVRVIPNDPADWRHEACNRLPRNLTPEEWRVFVGEEIRYMTTCPNRP